MEMIEFKGNLSEAARNFILRQNQRGALFISLFALTPFIVANLCLALFEDMLFLMFLPCWILFIVLSYLIKPKGKKLEDMMTNRVVIEEACLERESSAEYNHTEIEDIKKIIDYGEFYKIVFYFPSMNSRFICQKDLITQGSIEEFEERFSDKIIRKPLKRK